MKPAVTTSIPTKNDWKPLNRRRVRPTTKRAFNFSSAEPISTQTREEVAKNPPPTLQKIEEPENDVENVTAQNSENGEKRRKSSLQPVKKNDERNVNSNSNFILSPNRMSEKPSRQSWNSYYFKSKNHSDHALDKSSKLSVANDKPQFEKSSKLSAGNDKSVGKVNLLKKNVSESNFVSRVSGPKARKSFPSAKLHNNGFPLVPFSDSNKQFEVDDRKCLQEDISSDKVTRKLDFGTPLISGKHSTLSREIRNERAFATFTTTEDESGDGKKSYALAEPVPPCRDNLESESSLPIPSLRKESSIIDYPSPKRRITEVERVIQSRRNVENFVEELEDQQPTSQIDDEKSVKSGERDFHCRTAEKLDLRTVTQADSELNRKSSARPTTQRIQILIEDDVPNAILVGNSPAERESWEKFSTDQFENGLVLHTDEALKQVNAVIQDFKAKKSKNEIKVIELFEKEFNKCYHQNVEISKRPGSTEESQYQKWCNLIEKAYALDAEKERLERSVRCQKEKLRSAQERKRKLVEINTYLQNWDVLVETFNNSYRK